MRFEGKNVVVTGGGRGIGEAIARRFADEGAGVLLIARTASGIDEVAASIGVKAWAHAADVADEAQVQAAVDAAVARWGRIDVLVNNAGIDDDCPFLDVDLERWRQVIGVNLTGPFLVSQRVAREMATTGGGAIVHISSIDAHGADGSQVAYNASKAGLLGLSRTMAMELAAQGIRSNVVSPGYTATPLTRKYVGEPMYEYMTTRFARVPQGRMATPDEIASAVLFLASADAGAVTGAELIVDGGTTANLFVVETLPGE